MDAEPSRVMGESSSVELSGPALAVGGSERMTVILTMATAGLPAASVQVRVTVKVSIDMKMCWGVTFVPLS